MTSPLPLGEGSGVRAASIGDSPEQEASGTGGKQAVEDRAMPSDDSALTLTLSRRERGLPEHKRPASYHCQTVVSAFDIAADRPREDLLLEVLADLRAVWPQAREAKLLHHRVATQPAAVFALRPGVQRLRPAQQTPVENLFLAGDWTATGWPATMEGAVRSGRLAAEAMLRSLGRPCRLVSPDLPRGLLARWLCGRE